MANISKLLTASANVKPGLGEVYGLVIASTSSGTIVLYDSETTTTSTPLTGTITPTAGTFIDLFGLQFSKGLYAVIANTLSVTVVYK